MFIICTGDVQVFKTCTGSVQVAITASIEWPGLILFLLCNRFAPFIGADPAAVFYLAKQRESMELCDTK